MDKDWRRLIQAGHKTSERIVDCPASCQLLPLLPVESDQEGSPDKASVRCGLVVQEQEAYSAIISVLLETPHDIKPCWLSYLHIIS